MANDGDENDDFFDSHGMVSSGGVGDIDAKEMKGGVENGI